MSTDRKDFINGMRGVLDAFEREPKDLDYWEKQHAATVDKRVSWCGRELHLFSWYLGREQAILSVLATFDSE